MRIWARVLVVSKLNKCSENWSHTLVCDDVELVIFGKLRLNNPVTCNWTRGDRHRLRRGPLISLTGERERIPSRHLDRFKVVAVFQTNRHQQDLYLDNMETITDSRGGQKRIPWAWSSWLISVLRTQGSAQVRAATAQVQRRKWTLVRARFGADYMGKDRG
jgi:hypothetical protein